MKTQRLESRIAEHLLYPFGDIVSAIGKYILTHGPQTCISLFNSLNIPLKKIKQGLIVLVHHNLIHEYFNPISHKERQGIVPRMYSFSKQNLFFRIFHPLWIYLAESMYGENGARIVMYMCTHTIASISSLENLDDNSKRILSTLMQERYFTNIDQSNESVHIDKKQKIDKNSTFVTLNHDRFFMQLQSHWLIKWTETRIDVLAGTIMRIILEESNRSDNSTRIEISVNLLKSRLEPESFNDQHMVCPGDNASTLDLYIDEICFLSRGFLSRTQSNTILFKPSKAYCEFLPFNYLSDLITKRYNPESSKIFRLLSFKHILDEKQVQKFTMIGLKEAREKLFQLFRDGWIQIQQVPKTPDHIPSRTFYLCRYNLDHSRRSLYTFLFKSYINCMDRYNTEKKYNTKSSIDTLESHGFSLLRDLALIAIR